MKKSITILNLSILFYLLPITLKAQYAEIVNKYWSGSSVQDADFTVSGKAYISRTLKVTLNSNNTVSGTASATMTMDNVAYTYNSTISGTFYPESWSMYIKDETITRADRLPSDLNWCKGWGTLYIYGNKEQSGHYILRGDMSSDCGTLTTIEYGD